MNPDPLSNQFDHPRLEEGMNPYALAFSFTTDIFTNDARSRDRQHLDESNREQVGIGNRIIAPRLRVALRP